MKPIIIPATFSGCVGRARASQAHGDRRVPWHHFRIGVLEAAGRSTLKVNEKRVTAPVSEWKRTMGYRSICQSREP